MVKKISHVDGILLYTMLASAVDVLQSKAERIDSINVFPVPDGDTGTNLLLTLNAAVENGSSRRMESVGSMAAAMAESALRNASGNAGVILSQFFLGFADGVKEKESFTAGDFQTVLRLAAEYSYKSMSDPVEGTMLTVLKDIAREAEHESGGDDDVAALLERVVQAAEKSVAKSPKLLPVLRKHRVVDAGAFGMYTILYGLLTGLENTQDSLKSSYKTNWDVDSIEHEVPKNTDNTPYGYCTEFLILGDNLEKDTIRTKLERMGSSLIIAGTRRNLRVHIHTADPGSVLHEATGIGALDAVSIKNMDRQHELFQQRRTAGKGKHVNIGIVTDSVSDLPLETAERLGITVVPLIVRFGTEVYRDGIDLSAEEFYHRLQRSDVFPETSVAPPVTFGEAYDRLAGEYDGIVAATLSSSLSGTYNSAVAGIQHMKKECPVTVVDTEKAALAAGLLVIKAAEAATEGASTEEIIRTIEENKSRIGFLATFDSLEYLKRGGRISKAKFVIGSWLHIHPLITLSAGRVTPAGSTLNRKKAMDRLYKFAAEYRRVEKVGVAHSACPEEADALSKRLMEKFPDADFYSSRLTPVMGTHTGPGLVLVAVLGDR